MNLRTIFFLLITITVSGCEQNADTVQLAETARLIQKSQIAVSVDSLTDAIIKRQENYRLIDLRSADQYDAGHIRTSQNMSPVELLSQEHVNKLKSGRDIYLYSETSDQAAQTAALLRTQGVPAYYLEGGHQAWSNAMHTTAGKGTASEQAMKQAVACWFEGDYVAEAGLAVRTVAGGYVPPLEPVSASAEDDALGLGLGIGLGPEETEQKNDSLGLGLGLGLGPEDSQNDESSSSGGKLIIGEGC